MSLPLVISLLAVLLTSPAQARSKAADYLIRDQIAGACETGKGKIEENAVIERDLTGDGLADLIISHDGITCSDGGRSNACGAQVCSFVIYGKHPRSHADFKRRASSGLSYDGGCSGGLLRSWVFDLAQSLPFPWKHFMEA
ncbi:MAG TPA: hypothetical protein VFO41_02745 [Alphaproteobacteria bacterium]|nr:hypothetical protein [Alphaproteobacteria bacterium]